MYVLMILIQKLRCWCVVMCWCVWFFTSEIFRQQHHYQYTAFHLNGFGTPTKQHVKGFHSSPVESSAGHSTIRISRFFTFSALPAPDAYVWPWFALLPSALGAKLAFGEQQTNQTKHTSCDFKTPSIDASKDSFLTQDLFQDKFGQTKPLKSTRKKRKPSEKCNTELTGLHYNPFDICVGGV